MKFPPKILSSFFFLKKSLHNRLTDRKAQVEGSALVIVLSLLVLITVLVVGMVSVVRLERISAHRVWETAAASSYSSIAADHAVALLRDAISVAEATSTNAAANTKKFWASQPGRITVFDADGTVDQTNSRNLFSTNATGESVDLNKATFSGRNPIIPGRSGEAAPKMTVKWVNVLKNPSEPASASNSIIGRYAYWVDDECTKINVNTSDGTRKGLTNSFGLGTPTEVSLQTLSNGAGYLTVGDAAKIATRSGAIPGGSPRSFNTLRELMQVQGVSTNVYGANYSDMTIYSRGSEINIFGEPKIYLMSASPELVPKNLMLGLYRPPANSSDYSQIAGPLTEVYPSSGYVGSTPSNSQLPSFNYAYQTGNDLHTVNAIGRLPQFPVIDGMTSQSFSPNSPDYDLGYRIARYLKGFNSQGRPIRWPLFEGSDPEGYGGDDSTGTVGKFTDRQIDSISFQILCLLKGAYADHAGQYTSEQIMRGFLSHQIVRGLNRGPLATEAYLQVQTSDGSVPKISFDFRVEYYFPKEFVGSEISNVNTGTDFSQWMIGYHNSIPAPNVQDVPRYNDSGGYDPSPLGGFWMDNLLTVLDEENNPAGVDFNQNVISRPDPDQIKAADYHPYTYDAARNLYTGSAQYGYGPIFALALDTTNPWQPGQYRLAAPFGNLDYTLSMKPGVTGRVKFKGGFTLGIHNSGSSDPHYGGAVEVVPLEAFMTDAQVFLSLTDSEVRDRILEAVIPVPTTEIEIPGRARFHMQVADPRVNNFPGDWQQASDPPASDVTLPLTATREIYLDGLNSCSNPSSEEGADPAGLWFPPQLKTIPKSQRFPSIGYLQYVHPGMMPDRNDDAGYNNAISIRDQKGTPFRILNFSPSQSLSQKTNGGASYPDWAMLDLFTVPATLQPLDGSKAIQLTWGGATTGRINPNAVLVPFGIERTAPLKSVFQGLSVSTSYDSDGNQSFNVIDDSAATVLANGINAYVKQHGRPLMLPGEICNVDEVAAYLYTKLNPKAVSRNDLVRASIGNLTTRSNTYTVWTIGQSVKKKKGNEKWGEFESGDIVQGEVRESFLLERYMDPGTDGCYGNALVPGPDRIIGTSDDSSGATSRANPTLTYPLPYKYRFVSLSKVLD